MKPKGPRRPNNYSFTGSRCHTTGVYCSACTARDTLKPVGCTAQGGKGGKSLTDKVPANSRKSYTLSDVFSTGRAAILVQSQNKGLPIMVERSMYWNNRGAGTDTIGGFSD